jgi:hypothetical protein
MNTIETIKATGQLKVIVTGSDGLVKDERLLKNLVVTTGLGYIASRMKDTSQGAMSHMAVGTNNTAAALGNTALGAEAARVALTSTVVTGSQIAYSATFPAGTPASLTALTEAAILNAASNGTMLCRTVFPTVNKDVGDTLSVVWTITLS